MAERELPGKENQEDIATIAKESLAKLVIRAKYANFKEVYRVSSNTQSPS